MLTRQKALLRLIANEGGSVGRTRLQKLAFTLANEVSGSPTSKVYQFVPYHFGPYSFTMAHELSKLATEGYLRMTETEIASTDLTPNVILDAQLKTATDFTSRRFSQVRTDVLVKTVYDRHPWYTCKARDRSKRLCEPPTAEPAIFTVGYEGLMLEGLLDLLLRRGVKRLVDVRANPVARQFGFHKSTLVRHCRDVDIDYLHLPELGIASSERANLQSQSSYDELFRKYEATTLRSNERLLAYVGELVSEKSTALMCMEADHQSCHRSRLASTLQRKLHLPIEELREK